MSLAVPLHAIELSGRWTKTETKNLIVYSNAHDFATKALVGNVERMRRAVGHIMNLPTDSAAPATLFVFDGEPSYLPLRRAVFGTGPIQPVGFFVHPGGRYYMAMQTDSGGGVDIIAYHEITHALLENAVTGLPLWYQEGMAMFYSTFTVKGKSVVVGTMPKAFFDRLMETGLMNLKRVLVVDEKSPEYNNAHAGDFYATSWVFVQYLLVGAPQRAGQLGKYLELVDRKTPVDVAFKTAFGTTPEQFQGELWGYVNRPKYQVMSYDFADLNAFSVPAPVAVETSEVQQAIAPLMPKPKE